MFGTMNGTFIFFLTATSEVSKDLTGLLLTAIPTHVFVEIDVSLVKAGYLAVHGVAEVHKKDKKETHTVGHS